MKGRSALRSKVMFLPFCHWRGMHPPIKFLVLVSTNFPLVLLYICPVIVPICMCMIVQLNAMIMSVTTPSIPATPADPEPSLIQEISVRRAQRPFGSRFVRFGFVRLCSVQLGSAWFSPVSCRVCSAASFPHRCSFTFVYHS